jgi:hypothetical protein
MSNRRLARLVIAPILLLAVLPGCQALHSYRPTPVQVIDADTKQPIAEAEVRISYPMANSLATPWESRETTGSNGIARSRAASFGSAGAMVEISAQGYMNEQRFLTAQQVEDLERAGWFEDTHQRLPALVVGLYKDPRPTIELVLPPGYRGMVKARVRVQDKSLSPVRRCSNTSFRRIFTSSTPTTSRSRPRPKVQAPATGGSKTRTLTITS